MMVDGVLSIYHHEAERLRSDLPWVQSKQKQGLADFQRLGFPKRQDEDWRYTSVDGFLKQIFHTAAQDAKRDELSVDHVMESKQTDVPWGNKIVCLDGVLIGLDRLRATLPPGVLVLPLLEAMVEHPEKIQPYLNDVLKTNNGFQAQNTAMLQLGLFIYVPAYVSIVEPILLVHWQTQAEQAVYLRHVMVVEAGAALTVIEDYQGAGDTRYYTNTVSECYVGPTACFKHYKIQRESHLAYHVGQLAIRQMAGSHCDSHVFSLGGAWSRLDLCVDFSAPEATCQLNGLYALSDQQHMDHHSWVYHDVPACASAQDYKGILTGQSRAVFNGQVHVAPYAQKTVAKQQNKNLLLSTQAEIDTKPQLDIAADDVLCTHGATVGQLDEEALFYFATRGIDEQQARQYLIQAFAADNLKALGHEGLTVWMTGLLDQHLGSHYEP